MIFSIDEQGDLFVDKDNQSLSDYNAVNETQVNWKIARTSILTYFRHKGFLQKNFIMYKRNNFSDEYVRNLIQDKINDIFKDNIRIIENIGFSFSNEGDLFIICFFYKINENENKSLLNETIII